MEGARRNQAEQNGMDVGMVCEDFTPFVEGGHSRRQGPISRR